MGRQGTGSAGARPVAGVAAAGVASYDGTTVTPGPDVPISPGVGAPTSGARPGRVAGAVRGRYGARAASNGTTATTAPTVSGRWPVASDAPAARMPPVVHQPCDDGRIGRPYRSSRATPCMLEPASTRPSARP